LPQGEQFSLFVGCDGLQPAQAVEGWQGSVIQATSAGWMMVIGQQVTLFLQTQNRLKEVVVEPEFVIQAVEQAGLRNRIQTPIANIGADEREIVLFDEAVVVFVEGATARDFGAHFLSPEAQQMGIEEF